MSAVVAVLLYVAVAFGVAGLAARIHFYARTPAPLRIPTTPAPRTRAGVVLRMLREIFLFESLFKASKWTWLFGWTFHAGLALVLAGHLQLFFDSPPLLLYRFQAWAVPGAWVMVFGLAGLWIRRIAVDRVRYVSAPSDHAMLALFVAIAASGLGLHYVAPVDPFAVKRFVAGWLGFGWPPLPASGVLAVHLCLVAALAAVFPVSKLLHAPGILFSPTRNQVDDARARRHRNPWGDGHDG